MIIIIHQNNNICRHLIYGTLLATSIFKNRSCSGPIFLCKTIYHHGGVSIPFYFSQSNCTFSLLKSHKDYLFHLSLIVFLYFVIGHIDLERNSNNQPGRTFRMHHFISMGCRQRWSYPHCNMIVHASPSFHWLF